MSNSGYDIPTIGITMGDPAGIGPEVVARSLAGLQKYNARFVVYGSNELLTIAADLCNETSLRWHRVDANSERANAPIHQQITVFDDGEELHSLRGEPSEIGGHVSKQWVEQAIADSLKPTNDPRRIDGVVTAPICKASWALAGYRWAGHTELFATRTKAKRHAMAFISPTLRVVLATCHIPLMHIRNVLTIGRVFDAIDLANDACLDLGIDRPRIAVTGLNPHAGENGLLGDEETRLIEPAIKIAHEAGIRVNGPFPADTLFNDAVNGSYDIVVAMYHDQGLLPVKLLHQHQAVNWTLGLPIIRTSPDHGTAFNIVGKNQANIGSMQAAIKLALDLAKTRETSSLLGFAICQTNIQWKTLFHFANAEVFIFPASEIYGGINGFWDYGPMGTELKNNLRDAWWHDMVHCPPMGPDGEPLSIVGIDSSIIQNPKVWEASGHVGGFNDPMVDCRESKARYRADHLLCLGVKGDTSGQIYAYIENDDDSLASAQKKLEKYVKRTLSSEEIDTCALTELSVEELAITVGPDTKTVGTLTEPRQFSLMFDTTVGATGGDENKAYLRPETAQGIFLNFMNVVDTMRVKVPFGIAQIGKAFRNEVTPRNFIFRSREFEQMELEWFCHEDDAQQWYEFWCNYRKEWWQKMGLTTENLQMRQHDADELAHYAKEGCGTFDIEYKFPFTDPGYGELEGVAHRGNFDLSRHTEFSGKKINYFDQAKNERYTPHVIEPSAGLSRGTLALLCEAYTPDDRPSKVFMKFNPRIAPIKAAIFPLVNKNGMPEIAKKLHEDMRQKHVVQYDAKQSIGKRYARMDEAGTPFCFVIDGDTLEDNTITVRDRDTASQERINIDQAVAYLDDKLSPA